MKHKAPTSIPKASYFPTIFAGKLSSAVSGCLSPASQISSCSSSKGSVGAGAVPVGDPMPAFIFVVVAIERSPPFPTTAANLLPHPDRALLLLLLLRLLPKRRREARRIEDIIILFFPCEECLSSVRQNTRFSKVCLFKNSFFRERKDKREERILIRKKARAQFASFYIHASLHASLHAALARKSLCFCELRARARENEKERERERNPFLCVCLCVCVFECLCQEKFGHSKMEGGAAIRDKAISIVKEAVKEDKAGNYETAFTLYMQSLDHFKCYLKYEKNPRMQDTIKGKFNEYLERAEELHKIVAEQKNATDQATESGNPEAMKARPGSNGAATTNAGGSTSKEDSAEQLKMKQQLGGAIVTEKPNVKWSDVAGLDLAKDALKEAVILPVKFPQFFTGKRKAWSGFLLYGPPGTGKSYLAKAVATEADSTFFSVSSSDLVSKWMGESEKLVNNLFSMAREKSPSIIFIDEIDALCGARGESGESEASRRIKTEILVQMQGVGSDSAGKVLVLAATNTPYSLDQAVRRRFDKRIYIPLPEAAARAHMFKVHVGETPHDLTNEDFESLGVQTPGFSGSDIDHVVKDVLYEPVRKTQEATHFKTVTKEEDETKEYYVPCSPGDPSAWASTLDELASLGYADRVMPPPITLGDFKKILLRARPTVAAADLEVHERFTKEFGEEG